RLYPGAKIPSGRSDRLSRNDRTASRTDRRSNPPFTRPSSPSGRDSSRDNPRDNTGRADRNTGGGPTPSTPKQPVVIPPPISDSEIARLSGADAMKEFATRKKAATQAGIDEGTTTGC